MDRVVSIGDFAASANADDIIKTFALSTCVAITVYNPVRHVLGMIHVPLPDSSLNPDDSRQRPYRYMDTAVPAMMDYLAKRHHCLPAHFTEVKVYGGVSMRRSDIFQIGPRNVQAAMDQLQRYGLSVTTSDTGGEVSRTLFASVDSGQVQVIRNPLSLCHPRKSDSSR